jgi:chemotaxis protein MotB
MRMRSPRVSQERWLVSYADLLVLLLAVFVVLYASARVDIRPSAHSTPLGPPAPSESVTSALQQALAEEIAQKRVALRNEHGRVILSLSEVALFRRAAADLEPQGQESLRKIAGIVAHQDFGVRVEGHTDAQSIHNPRFASNWELSVARAMSVARVLMEDGGVRPGRVSIAGYAGYHPVAANDTEEGRAANRRVDLILEPPRPE